MSIRLFFDQKLSFNISAVPSMKEVYISMQIRQQLSDVPRDERTLFVTFSNGYPLTKDELHDFFMRCVCHFRFILYT
jgi:hypothetical protein